MLSACGGGGGASDAGRDTGTTPPDTAPPPIVCIDNGTGGYMCASPEGCPFPCCTDGVISTCRYPINVECNSQQMVFTPCGENTCVQDGQICPSDAGVDAAVDASADASTDRCGGCPAGTSCGMTGGGVSACISASGVPRFSHVFVMVMENTSLSTLMEATNTPFIDSLFADWASSSDYHGVTHPSLGNYLAMVSGMDTSVIGCDCQPTGGDCNSLNCNAVLHSCGCAQSITHLGDQLEMAGLAWMDYAEDMGSPCNTSDGGNYVARHVPFLYFENVQSDAARCAAHVVDYGEFAVDLPTAATYSLIAPNLVHDMHDPITGGATNLANGNAWLTGNVPRILESPAFTDGGLLVIVWDEDDLSGVLAPDDPIALIVMSPYVKRGGYVSTTRADHSSLLATIEDGLGLDRLGSAAGATPLSDFFAP